MAMVDLFLESIKPPETRKDYVDAMKRFSARAGIKTDLRRIGPKKLQKKLIEYVVYLKTKGSSYSTQNIVITCKKRLNS